MSIPLPNLDDRTFSDLVEEVRALIPRYAPEWTDHNVSDPGIMLIELFAWLTEALIYRLNRIPEASVVRMLELLGATFQPARPATVDLNVTATGLYEDLIVPQGTPLTANPGGGGGTVPFETIHDLKLTPDKPTGVVKARQTARVQDEPLGMSDGQAHQVFRLARPFLAGDSKGDPMVSQVTVGGKPWTYKPSLLDLTAEDFTVESQLGVIRFGDGSLGKIPPQGEEIIASYRYTLGQQGNVSRRTKFAIDERSIFLPPQVKEALDSGVVFSFTCQADASGGTDPTGPDDARDQVTNDLKTRWRAITKEDFEKVVLEQTDLNLARAKCLPELDLTASDPYTPRPGHISVVVVPDSRVDKPEPSPECIQDVWDFLDQRRLITCRHHVVGPTYTDVGVRAEVVRIPQVSATELLEDIEANLRDFFDPLKGGPGPEQEGWPFGRDVYASEAYQVIENTEGVDHVESLTLRTREDGGWGEPSDWVAIAPHRLVHFVYQPSDVEVRVVR
jgi:hypothetical protein